MNLTKSRRRTITLCAMCFISAGCGGTSTALLPSHSPSSGPSSARALAAPDVAEDLIYVSDIKTATVYMYGGNPVKQVGKLTGFSNPGGMCVDASQDVYVVDGGAANTIYEYKHGGRTPIKKLTDSYGFPLGCSIDPKTGNLAVTDIANTSSQEPGNLIIFQHASGAAQEQSVTNMSVYYFPTYDSSGDLFVDGVQSTGGAEIAMQPQGRHFWKILRFRFYYEEAFGMQWDGHYVAICDPTTKPNTLYEFSISGGSGFLKGTTTLKYDEDTYQFWIGPYSGHTRVAATNGHGAAMYPYPGGGVPLFKTSGLIQPAGVVVSRGTKTS